LLNIWMVAAAKTALTGTAQASLVYCGGGTIRSDPETRDVKNTLVRHGGELPGPASMVLDIRHIAVIASVGSHSRMAMAI
jgi:hypothetical protein